MKEVYHTSNVKVEHPDTHHSRKALDFGPGFYFTHIKQQAQLYAHRFTRLNKHALINVYDMNEDWGYWKVKVFDCYNEEWLDFVLACRDENVVGDYDMVVGGIADDKVFETLNLFFDHWISKEEALHRLKYEKPNIQYCIRTEAMLQHILTYKYCIEL